MSFLPFCIALFGLASALLWPLAISSERTWPAAACVGFAAAALVSQLAALAITI